MLAGSSLLLLAVAVPHLRLLVLVHLSQPASPVRKASLACLLSTPPPALSPYHIPRKLQGD